MTQKRRDNKSTEFGLWLRGQLPEQKTEVDIIDSKLGFVATNIDYLWHNHKSGRFMFIEEKRHARCPKLSQITLYRIVDLLCSLSIKYDGFHILVFENTNPEDGGIWLDNKFISKEQLITWLAFNAESDWYKSYFTEANPNKEILKIIFEDSNGD